MAPAFQGLIGKRVDRYEVLTQIGQGGFGAVYRARHVVLGTEVALKVLWPDLADDPRNVERFLREARAVATIGSDRIVEVHDAGQTADETVFLAMELLRGRDLDEELATRGALPPDRAVAIMRQVLIGLQAAHAKGIVHRDLKPANVFLVDSDPGTLRVKLLDFRDQQDRGGPEADEDGHRPRHAAVHGAGAGAGQPRPRRPRGLVRGRGGPLPAALRGGPPRGHRLPGARAAGERRGPGAPEVAGAAHLPVPRRGRRPGAAARPTGPVAGRRGHGRGARGG